MRYCITWTVRATGRTESRYISDISAAQVVYLALLGNRRVTDVTMRVTD